MLLLRKTAYRKRLALPLFLALTFLLTACTLPSASEQDKNWTSSPGLIESSDRILVAKFLDAREENIQLVDSVTGAISGETDVLYRQFELFDVLKGTSDRGDTLWVAFEPGRTGELVDGVGTVTEFNQSDVYVLFLKGRLRPIEYPVEFGPALWTANGEPAIARLVGENLEFRAERQYLNLLIDQGRTLPDPISASPFTLTLEDIREAVN